ncbi:MAG: stage II sporulation protein R [Ruminococcus sp.]|nr:stage II sporulation protein R [Ruminococcus sp.]
MKKGYILSDSALIAIAMTASLALSGIFTALTAKEHLEQSVVRLHILAESDSEEDQTLKLKVRDAVLAASEELFAPYSTAEEAERSLKAQMDRIKEISETALRENGCGSKVVCEMTEMPFDDRVYGGYTVPAGTYTALRITIGGGSGKNWWCVMYPPLCIPCAGADMTDEEIIEKYGGELTADDMLILTENEDVQARLYIADLIKKLIEGDNRSSEE